MAKVRRGSDNSAYADRRQDLEEAGAWIEQLRLELEAEKIAFGKYQKKVLIEMADAVDDINNKQARIEELQRCNKHLEEQCMHYKAQAQANEEDFSQERRDRERAHTMLDDARTQIKELEERGKTNGNNPERKMVYSHEEMAEVQAERDEALQQAEHHRRHVDRLQRELEEERGKSLQQHHDHMNLQKSYSAVAAENKQMKRAKRERSERVKKALEMDYKDWALPVSNDPFPVANAWPDFGDGKNWPLDSGRDNRGGFHGMRQGLLEEQFQDVEQQQQVMNDPERTLQPMEMSALRQRKLCSSGPRLEEPTHFSAWEYRQYSQHSSPALHPSCAEVHARPLQLPKEELSHPHQPRLCDKGQHHSQNPVVLKNSLMNTDTTNGSGRTAAMSSALLHVGGEIVGEEVEHSHLLHRQPNMRRPVINSASVLSPLNECLTSEASEQSGFLSLEPDPEIPPDKNLICTKCGKQYKHGEIQKYKLHFSMCPADDVMENSVG